MSPDEITAMAERLDLPPLMQWQIDALERLTTGPGPVLLHYPRIGGRAAMQRILDEIASPLAPSSAEGTPHGGNA